MVFLFCGFLSKKCISKGLLFLIHNVGSFVWAERNNKRGGVHLFSPKVCCVFVLFLMCFFRTSSSTGLKIHRQKLYQRERYTPLCGGRQLRRRREKTTRKKRIKEEDKETNRGGSSRFCIFFFCAVVAPHLRFFLRSLFSCAFLRARIFSIFVSSFSRWLPHRSS